MRLSPIWFRGLPGIPRLTMLVATAGHVDHGKTTLIKTLTGTDTDRLQEEKSRGLSIELGFAYLKTPKDGAIGFVDVPGHERFIRNMAAGVAGIDVAMLLVAADDGVMPQTKEHVSILGLYGVKNVLPVVTRIDLVTDQALQSSIISDIEELLVTKGINALDPHCISSVTGEGINALKQALFDLAEQQANRQAEHSINHFRMAIDRSFSIEGAGTVVTGTVYSGAYQLGDELVHLPSNTSLRVKSIAVNGQRRTEAVELPAPVNTREPLAQRGDRVSFNISGLAPRDIARGDWICHEQQTVQSACLDIEVSVLADESKPLAHWSPVHCHCGATSLTANVSLYDDRAVAPGHQCLAQLVLPKPIHAVYGDRIVLRDATASRTIGGAVVIDPVSKRYRGYRKNRPALLNSLHQTDPEVAIKRSLDIAQNGIEANAYRLARNLTPEYFDQLITGQNVALLDEAGGSAKAGNPNRLLMFSAAFVAKTGDSLVSIVRDYHETHPQSSGLAQTILMSSVRQQDNSTLKETTVRLFIEQLLREGTLKRSGNTIGLAGFTPELGRELTEFHQLLQNHLGPENSKPPSLSVLTESLGLAKDELLARVEKLVKAGHLVRVSSKRVIHPEALDKLVKIARDLDLESEEEGFDAKTFNQRSGIGRNRTIEVLEYLDEAGYTRRLGDLRIWRPRVSVNS